MRVWKFVLKPLGLIDMVKLNKVLVLYSYGSDISAQSLFTRGLQNQCEQERFDVILMDINRPYLDGYSATAIIREKEKILGTDHHIVEKGRMIHMGSTRKIRRIVTGSSQIDGAGVKLVRVIGHADVEEFDPFLMLDAFDSHDPVDYIKGFPWHPHRGIETVTYLIAGNVEHRDSLGNKGNILDGCCQWMTAGSGILHQEMPQSSDRMLGVQLWLNLPRKDKMTEPQYRDISASMIPKIQGKGCTVGVIAGSYGEVSGVTHGDYVKTLFLDVELKPGSEWRIATDTEATVFIYIVEGSGYFDAEGQTVIESHRTVLFENGEQFVARATEHGVRFLLFSGQSLREPIAWGGPIVMNTREELQQAFREIDNRTFIKKNSEM